MEQEIVRAPVEQPQTLTERCFTWLVPTVFMLQLVSVPFLSMFLFIQALIFSHSKQFKPLKWYHPLLTSLVVSGILSSVLPFFVVYNLKVTIKATIWSAPVFTATVGIFLIPFNTSEAKGIISALLGLFAIVQFCYAWFITSRHIYTNRILSVSAGSPPAKTDEIVIFSVFLSVFYSTLVVIGIGGATCTYTRTGLDIVFISIIMISLAWTTQVLIYLLQVTISMIRYLHFTTGEEVEVWNAFLHTLDTQFGSICVGSTLVPLIVLIRGLIRSFYQMLWRSDEVMYNSTGCCSNIANNLIAYGNRWGFVHVGVSEKGFVQASGDTWNTFRRTVGLEKLIDSDVTSSICFLSAIAVGAVSALSAGVLTFIIHKDYVLELTLYAFFIGYFVGRVGVAWLEACVMGYYVAYADDPQSNTFDNTIPRQIQRLQRQSGRHDVIPEV